MIGTRQAAHITQMMDKDSAQASGTQESGQDKAGTDDHLQQKRGRGGDTLLQCLRFLSEYYGHARSPEALKAGLAYDEQGMNPAMLCAAARRIDMKAAVVKVRHIRDIENEVLPAILVLSAGDDRENTQDGKSAGIILLENQGGRVKIYDPASGKRVERNAEDLNTAFSGEAIYIQPTAAFMDPESRDLKANRGHWFRDNVRANSGLYIQVLIGAVMINLFGLVSPIFIMNVYDRVIPNDAITTGWVLGVGALTVFVFDLIIRTLRGYFIDLAGRRIDVVTTTRIFDQVLDIRLGQRPPSSGVFASMLRDFDTVRDFLTSATLTALVDLPFSLLYVLAIYLLGGPIALILLALMAFVIVIGLIVQVPLKRAVARSVHSSEAKHGLLVESINALETIKAVGADGRMRARYAHHVAESAKHAQTSRHYSAVGANSAAFAQQVASVLIVLAGMYMVRDGSLSVGALIACVILGGRALSPIGRVANLMTRYHQSVGALRTIDGIMKRDVERPADKNFLHRPDLTGKIAFRDASFAYPNTDINVLKNVTLHIEAGEKVGIVGRVGSGKSTLARLMMNLYQPDSGAVYADDTDYRQIDPADLRRNMAYISQDVLLFRGTVRDNITAGRPQASEDDILHAAKAAGVHDFIRQHPMGYDAPVGERGEGLSGGQRQAVALARAILMHPNIFICDEPTNAMDVQAEEAFQNHILEEVADKTLVLITHRTSLLSLVNRLVVMDQGEVVADGPKQKVLEAIEQGRVRVRQ